MRLGAFFRLLVVPDFAIEVGFNFGQLEKPFNLTIFVLGGGGFLIVTARYVPAQKSISCSVSLGITASASLAIALGPIKGGVYVYFGVTAEYDSATGGGMTIGVMLLVRGEVSILGIVEAAISLLLEAKYGNGRLIGHGRLSIKIKICWCFTLEVEEDVTYEIAGSGSGAYLNEAPRSDLDNLLAFNASPGDIDRSADVAEATRFSAEPETRTLPPLDSLDEYARRARRYLTMLA
jgi:hypothetical protein